MVLLFFQAAIVQNYHMRPGKRSFPYAAKTRGGCGGGIRDGLFLAFGSGIG